MRFNLGFFLAEAFKNIRLNLLMSITAVTTTFICILVFGVGLLVSEHVEGVIGSVREDVSVEVFMPGRGEKEVAAIEEKARGWGEVSSVERISEEQALAAFKDTFREQPELYENLDRGVLPASLQIQLTDPDLADEVAGKLKAEGFSEENLSYPQQTIERLNSVTSYMIWGLYAATILSLGAGFLLSPTPISLSFSPRRKEIEVMKLVGASDGFVRTPFVLEGLIQGLLGAGLAALAVVWLNFLFVDWSRDALTFVPIAGNAVSTLSVLLVLVIVGVAIGVGGSFLSVTRFLRKI